MKRILLLVLTVTLALSCFISCSYFGGDSSHDTDDKKIFFISPEDEEAAVRTVTQTDENGLKLEVTLHGYKSESLGKEFYVKNNEYFLVDIKLTNESDTPVYQFLPTSCRDASPAHNHEISFDIANGDYKLNSSSFGFECAEATDLWTVEPGNSYEWQLKLAAGNQQTNFIFQLPENGKENLKEDFNADKENAEAEKKSVADGYIYYDSNFVQNGNVQIYESTYIDGNFFGSGFTFDPSVSFATSYHFVVNGNVNEIMGLLPSDGNDAAGIMLHKDGIFPENVCIFEGALSFAYMKSNDGFENTLSVSVPLAIEVVYVSPSPNISLKK